MSSWAWPSRVESACVLSASSLSEVDFFAAEPRASKSFISIAILTQVIVWGCWRTHQPLNFVDSPKNRLTAIIILKIASTGDSTTAINLAQAVANSVRAREVRPPSVVDKTFVASVMTLARFGIFVIATASLIRNLTCAVSFQFATWSEQCKICSQLVSNKSYQTWMVS